MKKLYFQISKTKNMDPADFNNDPRDEVEQMDVEEEMDVVEETALAVPAVGAELVGPSRPLWQGFLRRWPWGC